MVDADLDPDPDTDPAMHMLPTVERVSIDMLYIYSQNKLMRDIMIY